MADKKLVWFRNDLRTGDHHALYHACQDSAGGGVIAVAAITPIQWLKQDEAKCRIQFWMANLDKLSLELSALNIPLKIIRVASNDEIPSVLLSFSESHGVGELYFNNEYPGYEQARDEAVANLFEQKGIRTRRFDSELVLPPGSVLNQQGSPYKVFTPFSRAWRQQFISMLPQPLPKPKIQPLINITSDEVPRESGYSSQLGANWIPPLWPAGSDAAHERLKMFVIHSSADYSRQRDFPGQPKTSSLSPYLSQGVISTRQCLAAMQAYSGEIDWLDNQWVTELIWREFYRHLLVLFPEMNQWKPFKPDVENRLNWQYDEVLFKAWCEGETGFAIVDAGMKQLLETGWMHNRVRMITASFLTKLLRQDWRLGARFFMRHLIDGDFASNLGGWQWSASVGADAAPYFRIFNPMRQAERFDKTGEYCAQWIPTLVGLNSIKQHDPLFASAFQRPSRVIDYAHERKQSLDKYTQADRKP
jgi:deoxyribodipyrimidine photo-lyase